MKLRLPDELILTGDDAPRGPKVANRITVTAVFGYHQVAIPIQMRIHRCLLAMAFGARVIDWDNGCKVTAGWVGDDLMGPGRNTQYVYCLRKTLTDRGVSERVIENDMQGHYRLTIPDRLTVNWDRFLTFEDSFSRDMAKAVLFRWSGKGE